MDKLNKKILLLLLIYVAVSLLMAFALTVNVFADSQDLETAKSQLEQVKSEYQDQMQEIEYLRSRVDKKNHDAIEAQNRKIKSQESFNKIAIQQYKTDISNFFMSCILSADSLSNLFQNMQYTGKFMDFYLSIEKEQDDAIKEFNDSINDLNSELSNLNKKTEEAQNKINQYQSKLEEFSKKENISKEEIVPDPGIVPPQPASSWKRGSASAYGGFSDPGSGSRTATGATITESSMGISIPISTPNLTSYYGRSVQIRLNGKTVIGTINDCGGLGGGARCMDVQPGIFHSFGFSTCQAWGVQNVEYIII